MRVRRILLALAVSIVAALPLVAEGDDPAKDLKSKDVAARLDAVETLRKDGGEQAQSLLVRALDDPDWEVIEKAADALATRGGPEAEKPLIGVALNGPVRRVRRAAARTVALLDAEAAATHWAKELTGDGALRATEALATAAQTVGDKAGDTLKKAVEKALKSKEGPVRAAAATALSALPEADRRAHVVRLFADADLVVAAAALSEAARAPDAEYLAPLVAELRRPELDDVIERRVSTAIVAALARIGDEKERAIRFREGVAPLASAKDGLVAGRAARLAGVLGSPPRPASPPTPAKEDAKPPTPPDPAAPPATLPPPVVPADAALAALESALAHKDPTARALATQALGRIGTPAALDLAARLAPLDASPRVRRTAIHVLATGRSVVADDATCAVVTGRLVGDADPSVREEAAVLLGVSGPEKAPFPAPVPALEKALDDPDWRVSVCAAVSLGKTRAPAAVAPLQRQLDPKKVKDWKRRGAAVVGLGLLRVKEAVPPVIAALDDKDPSVKRTAFEFLRRMTPRTIAAEREPWQAWWIRSAATYEFADYEKAAREAKKGGYAATPVEVYDKLDVVVLQSRGDHIEQLLEKLGITHRITRAAAVTDAQLHPFAVFFSNCTGEVQPADVERLSWFVRVGGYLFGSCWALQHTIELVYPGVVRKLPTKGDVLDYVPATPCGDSPFFEGVFPAFTQPVFVLWGSHLIEVLEPERVEVLIDGPVSSEHWGGGNLACWFPAGHGVILDSSNHFDHQGLEHVMGLKTGDDRKAYAMDHMCMDYPEMRQLAREGIWEKQAAAVKEVRDSSIFRFITNFVRQKRRADL